MPAILGRATTHHVDYYRVAWREKAGDNSVPGALFGATIREMSNTYVRLRKVCLSWKRYHNCGDVAERRIGIFILMAESRRDVCLEHVPIDRTL